MEPTAEEESAAAPRPDPDAAPVPESGAAGTVSDAVNGVAPAPRTRARTRRGRRALFVVACAALLGVAGGTAVGYGVQARRPPVSLGTLAQPGLAYPAKAGGKAVSLPVAQDAGARTSGDLRKALLPVPAGAVERDVADDVDGWLSLAGYADRAGDPSAFETLSAYRFRRAADEYWAQKGKPSVGVFLMQLQPTTDQHAEQWVSDLDKAVGGGATPLEGSTNGFVIGGPVPGDAGEPDQNGVVAVAARGDTVMELVMYGSEKISDDDIQTLARRQLDRI